MSSKLEILKTCENCKEQFIAKTTVTRFCGHNCAARSYKQRKKDSKIGKAIVETNKQSILSATEVQMEVVKQKEFLSIKEAYTLIGISERTLHRLIKGGTIQSTKIGARTIIKRSEIDKLFST